MAEESTKSNQSSFLPFALKSHSSEGTFFLSRENSFFATKLTSKEFKLQYNKSFNMISPMHQSCDSKFNQMLAKTNHSNVFNKVEELLSSIEGPTEILTLESYVKASDCLIDINQITLNSSFDVDDYVKALNYQSTLVEKMMKFVEMKINT